MSDSDDLRTIYAAVSNLTNSLKPVIEAAPQIVGSLTNLDNRLVALETIGNEILKTLTDIVVTVDNTAECAVAIGERTGRIYDMTEKSNTATNVQVEEVNRKITTVQESVPNINAGITTLLENAVPAVAIDGKIDNLTNSHNQILLLVGSIKDEVSPLLDALQGSPVLKMLGVKNV